MRYAILVAFLVLATFILYKTFLSPEEPIKSRLDGETYKVIGSYQDSEAAANLLAQVNLSILATLGHIKNKYGVNRYDDALRLGEEGAVEAGGSRRKRDIAERILKNYNFEVISENDPFMGSGTTYTVDKGARIKFCVRDKKDGSLHDAGILVFVGLHELAHIGNPTWGHNMDFWEVFKFILREAVEAGAYTPIDYKKQPVEYCGMNVNHNPLFDSSIADI